MNCCHHAKFVLDLAEDANGDGLENKNNLDDDVPLIDETQNPNHYEYISASIDSPTITHTTDDDIS